MKFFSWHFSLSTNRTTTQANGIVYAKCAIGKYTKATGFSIKLYRKVHAKTASKVTRIGLDDAKLTFAVYLQGQEEEMAAGEDATAADVAAAAAAAAAAQ